MTEHPMDPDGSPDPSIGTIPPDAGVDFRPDGRFYRIERDWLQLSRLTGIIGALVFSGGLFVLAAFGFFSDLSGTARSLIGVSWVLISILSLLRAWIVPALSYRRYLYRVDDTRLQIRRGVFWREVLDVPRNRIQHTDVAQGVLERSFDLSHLIVYTAGTTTAAVRLEGLRQEVAYRIRDELLDPRSGDAV